MDPMTKGEPVYLIPVRLQLQPTCICVTSGTAARKVPGLNVLVSEWRAIGDALDGMWPTHAIQQDPRNDSTEATWLLTGRPLGNACWFVQLDLASSGRGGTPRWWMGNCLKCSPNAKEV